MALDPERKKKLAKYGRKLLRFLRKALVLLAVAFVGILLYRAFDARKLPDLETWHTYQVRGEFDAARYEEFSDLRGAGGGRTCTLRASAR